MIDMDAAQGSDSDTAAASPLRRSDILIAVDQRGRGGVDGGPAFSSGRRGGVDGCPAFSAGLVRDAGTGTGSGRGGPAFSAGLSRDAGTGTGSGGRPCVLGGSLAR